MLVSIFHSGHHPVPVLCAYCLRRITGPCHHSPLTLDLVSSTSSPPHARSPTHPQHQHPHHSKPPPTWNCLACFVPLLPHALKQYVSRINGPNPPPSPPTHSPTNSPTHPHVAQCKTTLSRYSNFGWKCMLISAVLVPRVGELGTNISVSKKSTTSAGIANT